MKVLWVWLFVVGCDLAANDKARWEFLQRCIELASPSTSHCLYDCSIYAGNNEKCKPIEPTLSVDVCREMAK